MPTFEATQTQLFWVRWQSKATMGDPIVRHFKQSLSNSIVYSMADLGVDTREDMAFSHLWQTLQGMRAVSERVFFARWVHRTHQLRSMSEFNNHEYNWVIMAQTSVRPGRKKHGGTGQDQWRSMSKYPTEKKRQSCCATSQLRLMMFATNMCNRGGWKMRCPSC